MRQHPPSTELAQPYSPGRYYMGGWFPLLRHVLGLHPEGTALEFGVATGISLRMIAAELPAVGFDSFEGLPEDWRPGYPRGCMACEPPEVENARLVVGLFADTLPAFDFEALGQIGLVHIDCDIYSSTRDVLTHVGPWLRPGCFVVFDEWFAHNYSVRVAARNEQRAWRQYVQANPLSWDVIGRSDEEWAIRLT